MLDLDNDEHEQLLDLILFDEDGDDHQLHFERDKLQSLLHSEEQQLILLLCSLLEEQGLIHDDDGENKDELSDDELLDGELEEILLDNLLEEQLLLLKLLDKPLELIILVLEELQ